MPEPSLPRRVLALLPLFAVVLVSAGHWLELFGLWNDTSTLGHGWLLLALVGWELWQRRPSIAALEATFDPHGFLVLALLAAGWWAAYRLEIATIELTLLPPLLVAGLWAATGRDGLRACAFPLLLLLFATPVWFWLVPVLQQVTIVVVSFLVRAVGMTALIEKELITLPAGQLRIADSCSGVHQFVVATLIGTVFAWWHARMWRTRAHIIALACLTAIVTNWIRVFALVAIGYVTDMEHYFVTVDHYWFGWALFGVSISLFFVVARRRADRSEPHEPWSPE